MSRGARGELLTGVGFQVAVLRLHGQTGGRIQVAIALGLAAAERPESDGSVWASVRDLSTLVCMGETTCWRHLQRLESDRMITRLAGSGKGKAPCCWRLEPVERWRNVRWRSPAALAMTSALLALNDEFRVPRETTDPRTVASRPDGTRKVSSVRPGGRATELVVRPGRNTNKTVVFPPDGTQRRVRPPSSPGSPPVVQEPALSPRRSRVEEFDDTNHEQRYAAAAETVRNLARSVDGIPPRIWGTPRHQLVALTRHLTVEQTDALLRSCDDPTAGVPRLIGWANDHRARAFATDGAHQIVPARPALFAAADHWHSEGRPLDEIYDDLTIALGETVAQRWTPKG